MKEVIEDLKEKFADAIVSVEEFRGQYSVLVKREFAKKIIKYLKEIHKFNHLQDLCGVDWIKEDPRFEVVYNLYSIENRLHITVKTRVPQDNPEVDTITDLWEGANWHERECYDMFGIKFKGHPDLRRILMPEDWDGHPLRKDYPVKGKELWRGFREILEEKND